MKNHSHIFYLVMINTEKYKELLEDQRFLNLLMAYGVDNWEGYSDAAYEFVEEK